jgi:hypothetical protein
VNDDVSKETGRQDTPPGRSPEQGAKRLLVVVGEAVTDDRLRDEIVNHLDGGEGRIYVLAPALAQDRLHQFAGDVDEGIRAARVRMEETLEELRGGGLEAQGAVGDSEPERAIEDALEQFKADEIIIVTHPDGDARWLEADAFQQASDHFEQPVTRITVERDGDDERITDVEEGPRGRQDRPEDEIQPRNFPPLTPRDILGILVAIVGTIVLIVLAANCGGGEGIDESSEGAAGLDGCDARLLLAGLVGLVNLAHIAALMLFSSIRYRGFWERAFSWVSLIGTPVAIVVSLLLE